MKVSPSPIFSRLFVWISVVSIIRHSLSPGLLMMHEYGILGLVDGKACPGCCHCNDLKRGQECPRRLISIKNPVLTHGIQYCCVVHPVCLSFLLSYLIC